MRVATGIAIIIAASVTMAQGQSLQEQEQETCAQQAKAAFQEYKGRAAPPGVSDYQSQYNKALNKCFVLIKQTSELNG